MTGPAKSRSAVQWRYTPCGKVRHALSYATHVVALCGVFVLRASDWRGTGTQAEYEQVEQLPECRRCARYLVGAR